MMSTAVFRLLVLSSIAVLISNCALPPSKKQIEAFRSSETVRIMVDQSYGEAKNVSLPFEGVARIVLERCTNLDVITTGPKDCDATLEIKARGRAVSARYRKTLFFGLEGGSSRRYSGAELRGKISLKLKDVFGYQKAFYGERECLESVKSSEYLTPSSAPFRHTFMVKGSYISALFELIGHTYDTKCIIAYLEDVGKLRGWWVRSNAIYALGQIKDPNTVGPLVTLTQDERIDVRSSAVDALKLITEKDFGYDYAKWNQWWEKNKASFPQDR